MRQIKAIVLLITISGIVLPSCKKLDVPSGTPSCIKKKIRAIKKEDVRNPSASVWQYSYDGQTVYYIPSYCCDAMSELYDDDCNKLCSPDGGISGGGDGQCSDFFTIRTEEKLIWQDDR